MKFKQKLEEEKSFSEIFLLVSIVLIGVLIWVVVDETWLMRPWKGYQKRFYKLEQQYLSGKISDEETAFSKTEHYKKYKELETKLKAAEARLNSDAEQERLEQLMDDKERLVKKELKPVTAELIANRNKKLEVEFHFGHHPEKKDEILHEIKELEHDIKRLEGEQAALVKKKDSFTQRISMVSADVDRYTSEIKQYTTIKDQFKSRLDAVKRKGPTLQVYQTFITETNMADRCMSCHAGIDKTPGISDQNPYKAHPNREYYLGNHPTNIFGCVVCHEGQGRAISSVKEGHGELMYWLTPLLKGVNSHSSCTKCHGMESELEEGAPILVKGRKLFKELGCYRCHETKGFQKTEITERTGPDLTNIAYSTQPEWLINWIQYPKHVRPDTRMPNFDFTREEAESIASYLWQVSDEKSASLGNAGLSADVADLVDKGKDLFSNKGCYVCHRDGDSGSEFAPNLFNIGEKLNYDYAVKWLQDPKKYQPKTVMPDFRLSEEEAVSMASYLMTLKEKDNAPIGDDILQDSKKADEGEALIKRYGCFSCHKIKGMEGVGRIGVELSKIGSKDIGFLDFGLLEHDLLHEVGLKHGHDNVGLTRRVWLETKLHDPRIFDQGRYKLPKDKLRMPNFDLKEDEIEALVVFLQSLVEQEIPSKFLPEPTEKQNDLFNGYKVVEKFNCIGCHQFSLDSIELNNGAVVEGVVKKEKKGKVYFQLWKDAPLLKKTAGKTIRFKKDEIVNHTKGVGGYVAPLLVKNLKETHGISEKEAANYLPPKLYGQGKKTQPNWLFSFLKSPVILRPWYKAVMPTFNMTDDEITKIVKYFSVRDEAEYPFQYVQSKDKNYLAKMEKTSPGYMEKAKTLFNSPTVNCISCHIRGDVMPEGKPSDWAPDLSIAKNRLRPAWIVKWLTDPQSVQPGTKMPTFFSDGMYQDILPGSTQFQIQSVMDFLMNFENSSNGNKEGLALLDDETNGQAQIN